jgi:DNA-binding MarR family transcriptional regulator
MVGLTTTPAVPLWFDGDAVAIPALPVAGYLPEKYSTMNWTTIPLLLVKDRIDRHLELWTREIPQMDPRVEAIVMRMQVLVRHISRQKALALAAHGLQGWEYQTLLDLRRRGAPYRATPTELASALDLSPAATTKRLDSLERSGYIRRTHDTDDRRRVYITLTLAGRRIWEKTVGDHDVLERELFGHLTEAEQEQMGDLLRRLVLVAEQTGTTWIPPFRS